MVQKRGFSDLTSVNEDTLEAEYSVLRELLDQAGLDASRLLAQAGINATEKEAAERLQRLDPETADDVKPLVLELLRQNSGLTVRVNDLLAQNKALLALRIAELEAKRGKPPKTPDNSSLPPSRGQQGEHRGADAGEESPRRPSGRGASARRGRPGARKGPGPGRSAADQADHNTDQSVPRLCVAFTFDIGEIGFFRVDSGAARTTQIGPKPVSPAGIPRAAPPAVIPAAAFMASGIKPVIRAHGAGAEPSAGSSEAARCSAAWVLKASCLEPLRHGRRVLQPISAPPSRVK